ncbi:transcription factor DIVARICATA-like isoform X2 [Telopea speciosissima]|uniref:transcription factor DIVARICATA-like isoform X1 n=1 Tax=Telopea speciosissima TaxID=54955 RepID=UPI001CC6A297|nr:transcription factor DIVARICATA-like isoform X1 [Telopea speciosissima]XP_043697900.1 transcription factor DIVARICATA-like isoform X2 [Telopea speciosissima]
MMKWGMEIFSPQSYFTNSNWFIQESKSTGWTHEENKMFENALAVYDKDTPDRWYKVAEMIPGKTVGDVVKQYRELEEDVCEIEAGRIPIPGYRTSSFTLEWVNDSGFNGLKQDYGPGGRRSSSGRPDQERKKGVPWTEEEHRLFLMGLKKYGKGDWRNISRNFVVSRTPTQVASHAQKYFIRQVSGGKDKRRSSIHDITTVNITDTRPPSPESRHSSTDQTSVRPQQHNVASTTPKTLFDWNQPSNGAGGMVFNPTHGNMFMHTPYGMTPYGLKLQGQNLHRESLSGSHNMVFQMQSSRLQPHG